MYLKEVRYEDIDWINVAHCRGPVADKCEYGNVPSGSINGG